MVCEKANIFQRAILVPLPPFTDLSLDFLVFAIITRSVGYVWNILSYFIVYIKIIALQRYGRERDLYFFPKMWHRFTKLDPS